MLKDIFEVLKVYGFDPIVRTVGLFGLILFGLSLIPSLSFVPKAFLLYVLTH